MIATSRLLVTVSALCFSSAAFAQAPTPPAAPVAPAVAAPAAVPTPTVAAPAPASANNTPITRAEFPELVKKALLDNPEMIMEAAQKLRDKQAVDQKKQAAEALSKNKAAVYQDTTSPMAGDPKGDVTLVEFFDYHCGYCKHMLPTVTQLLKEDKKVRVIFREFPILSEDSVTASRAALAVNRIAKDKYFEYHTALMGNNGKFDEKFLFDTAKKLGINADKLKAEMAKPEITTMLDETSKLANDLGIRGTPALIIGDEVQPGAVAYDDLKKLVETARKSGSK